MMEDGTHGGIKCPSPDSDLLVADRQGRTGQPQAVGVILLWEGKHRSKQKQVNEQAYNTVMASGSLFY